MSVGPQPERVAGVQLPALGPRVMGLLALFVRLAIGLSLLNIGLATVMSAAVTRFGGPGMGGPSGLPGLEMLVTVLPYATLAIGVGLVFGIFTTISALLACGLVLLLPLAITYRLVIAAGMPMAGFAPYPGMMGFGGPGGEGFVLLCFSVLAAPGFVALVLLSAPSINRYSFDALMFGRSTAPVLPPPGPTRPPGEASDVTIRDISAPG